MLAVPLLLMALAGGGERPPECVTVKVSQPAGAVWLEFCGGGPGQESPLHDWAAGNRLIVDGFARLIRPSDCPRSAPCVLFASRPTPPS